MPVTSKKHSSWGQYWAEMGYMRLEAGKNLLGIEGEVAWASKFRPCRRNGWPTTVLDTHASSNFTYVQPPVSLPSTISLARRMVRIA
jgi:hypothetical protein